MSAAMESIASPKTAVGTDDEANLKTNQIVSFRLGDEEYGLDIMNIQEIIQVGAITQMPQTAEHIRGLINLRGHVIPIMDLRLFFGLPECDNRESQRIIVVNVARKTTGIIVDEVNEVLRVKEGSIERPPAGVKAAESQFLRGLIKLENKIVILLDIERLFTEQANSAGPESPAR